MMTPLAKAAEDDPYARRRLRYRVACRGERGVEAPVQEPEGPARAA